MHISDGYPYTRGATFGSATYLIVEVRQNAISWNKRRPLFQKLDLFSTTRPIISTGFNSISSFEKFIGS